ncbi:MAG: DinB family protein [Ignavibacteria bacterium]|nr:DinB family protein [Ignavibacteria bacterium]
MMKPYHGNVSKWFRNYILFLVADVDDSILWKKTEFANSPGWTLMHLIVEGELALKKLVPEYECRIGTVKDFEFGSDGTANSGLAKQEMTDMFISVYSELDEAVAGSIDLLYSKPNTDELLKDELSLELDFYLHMLTTHIAMHCDALTKWRKMQGIG